MRAHELIENLKKKNSYTFFVHSYKTGGTLVSQIDNEPHAKLLEFHVIFFGVWIVQVLRLLTS